MKSSYNKYKTIFIIVLAFAILIPGYYSNTWRAAGKKWFMDWQQLSDGFVVARIVQSRQGIFSYGALLGVGDISKWNYNSGIIDHEYQLYLKKGTFTNYMTYNSVPGLQAIPFSLVDQFSPVSPLTGLRLFRFGEVFLAVVVFALFLLWVERQFGLVACLFVLLFMAASEWLTLYGMNIYWNLWAFYLPLILLCYYFGKADHRSGLRLAHIFSIMALGLFLKCLVNGFEFISAALVMPFTPLVYFAWRDRWQMRDFIRRFLAASAGALTGTVAALGLLIIQVSLVLGGFSQALGFVGFTFGKRTFGDPAQYSALEADSLRANVLTVISVYLQGRVINIGNILHLTQIDIEMAYWQLFVIFAIVTGIYFVRERFFGGFPQSRTAFGMVLATWFSALAPLSWLILFKAHSYIHTQLNFILWQMPFTLFGMAMCGFIIANIFRKNGAKLNPES